MMSGPSLSSMLETECLFGETVKIINKKNDWFYCRLLTDNYEGWVNQKNIGIYDSLIQGVSNCAGEFIFRLDHDDVWRKDHVEVILNMYQKNHNVSLYATKAIYVDKDKKFLKESQTLHDKNIRKILLWDNPLVQSSIAFVKKDFLKVFKKTNMYSLEDYNLWIKLLKLGKLKFSSEPTLWYYVYENSLSRQNIERNYKERYLCQLKAIRSFFIDYPFRSILILFIVVLRLCFLYLKKFLKNLIISQL